jgi:hypothetical protein
MRNSLFAEPPPKEAIPAVAGTTIERAILSTTDERQESTTKREDSRGAGFSSGPEYSNRSSINGTDVATAPSIKTASPARLFAARLFV